MPRLSDPDVTEILALHDGRPDRVAHLLGLISDGGQILDYRTEGVLRAYLVWRPGPQGPEVCALYVAPGWRRRGISRRLIRRVADVTQDSATAS